MQFLSHFQTFSPRFSATLKKLDLGATPALPFREPCCFEGLLLELMLLIRTGRRPQTLSALPVCQGSRARGAPSGRQALRCFRQRPCRHRDLHYLPLTLQGTGSRAATRAGPAWTARRQWGRTRASASLASGRGPRLRGGQMQARRKEAPVRWRSPRAHDPATPLPGPNLASSNSRRQERTRGTSPPTSAQPAHRSPRTRRRRPAGADPSEHPGGGAGERGRGRGVASTGGRK